MSGAPAQLDETPQSGHPPRLELVEWRERFGVVAGITARDGDFNVGLGTAAPAGQVLTAWRTLLQAMAPRFQRFELGLQVHGARILEHRGTEEGWTIVDGVDGHLTAVPGTLLLVTVADCVPVYLLHPESRTAALVHAGWRGVAAGIVEAAIARLAAATASAPRDIVMHCGVAICGDCYEVGPEVISAVLGREAAAPEHLDLRSGIAARGERAGVRDLTVSGWCASHDAARFHSHRRSRGLDGRMAAYLGVPAA
ncbi:MAG TPA: laccase domain-containing protein [Gemmatimonadales bacterium]|nr:laccase domain-containing protein [Gemmatimonadales bacterium]